MFLLKNKIYENGIPMFVFFLLIFSSSSSFSQEKGRLYEGKQQINNQLPEFKNQEEKNAWFLAHPDKTTAIKIENENREGMSTTLSHKTKVNQEKSTEYTIIEEEITFPKFIDTGNPKKDQTDYATRKQLWIKENPEAYKKLQDPVKSKNETINPSKN